MNIDIPSDLNHFVQEMISRGAYRNEHELLLEGLRLLQSREQIRADVEDGLAELDAGKGKDGEQVFARLEARARAIAEQKAE